VSVGAVRSDAAITTSRISTGTHSTARLRRSDLVIAAFHTYMPSKRARYTQRFFFQRKSTWPPESSRKVTTDPATEHAGSTRLHTGGGIGAGWTFATGSKEALTAFWKPFGVQLASGNSHVSTPGAGRQAWLLRRFIAACRMSATTYAVTHHTWARKVE